MSRNVNAYIKKFCFRGHLLKKHCIKNSQIKSYNYCSRVSSDNVTEITENKSWNNCETRKNIEKWIDTLKNQGEKVPNQISEENFLKLFSLQTYFRRKKFLAYLYEKENATAVGKNVNHLEEEIRRKTSGEKVVKPKTHIEYGFGKNTMFIEIHKKMPEYFLNYKLINALKFNQPLVIDLGFYDFMNEKEASILAKQLVKCINQNRLGSEPFNLILCNVDFDCTKFQKFSQTMPDVLKSSFPLNISSKSYLDMFPKEKLIYLTPYTTNQMLRFNHNAIYILGGIVDGDKEHSLTSTKARKENIKMMKIPLDIFNDCKRLRPLDLNLMLKILFDLQKDERFVQCPLDYFKIVHLLLLKHNMYR